VFTSIGEVIDMRDRESRTLTQGAREHGKIAGEPNWQGTAPASELDRSPQSARGISMANMQDKKWAFYSLGILVPAVGIALIVLWGALQDGSRGDSRIAAVLAFAGVLVTTSVALIGQAWTRHAERRLDQERLQAEQRLKQEHEDEQNRLKLDAAMRAGALLSPAASAPSDPAAIAAGLLALTALDRADLAVALLVDLWSDTASKVSTETAVLVIDAALRSTSQPNAQLVGAELLCRNAKRLDPVQSLHWPSVIDGCWDTNFGPKTKLLIIDALLGMTLAQQENENALRSVAVRLYGAWEGDDDQRVKGCLGTLIASLLPKLESLGYTDFMGGNQKYMISQFQAAAKSATRNPDGFLDRLVSRRGEELSRWVASCNSISLRPGALADA
jgi:hypothetical protein